MNTKNKKIGILCYYEFPEGMAPTNRIRAYAKGLYLNGAHVETFIFKPKPSNSVNPSHGVVDGMFYSFSYSRPRKESRFSYKVTSKVKALLYTIKNIRKSNRMSKFSTILLSFDNIPYLLFFVPILSILHIPMAFIGDEFPEPIRQLKNKIPYYQLWLYKFIYCFIDKRVLMTQALADYYDAISPKPYYLLSSIIDTDRFLDIDKKESEHPYLCYMGNMMLAKDNVDNIIKAFSLISDKYSTLQLHLYGTPNETDKNFIVKCILDERLDGKVIFKGRASFYEVPRILSNAIILVTSQPVTKRAEGGFPTKLAEYMLSEVPAIVTNVGEIHLYVSDKDTVFMVEPCNPKAYSETISCILDNYDDAKRVAKRAKKLAIKMYGAREVTAGLYDFLCS